MVEDDVTKLTLSIQGARPRECPTFIIQNPGWPRAISRKLRGISYSYKERTEFVSPRTIPGFLLRRNASIIEIPPVPPSYNSFIILMTRLARCLATHCSSPCLFLLSCPFLFPFILPGNLISNLQSKNVEIFLFLPHFHLRCIL